MRLCVKIFVLLLCSAGLVKSSQDMMGSLTIVASVAQFTKVMQSTYSSRILDKNNLAAQDHELNTPSPKKRKALSPDSEDGLTSSESDTSSDDCDEPVVVFGHRSESFSRIEFVRPGARSVPPSDSAVSLDVFTDVKTPRTPVVRSKSQVSLYRGNREEHRSFETPSPVRRLHGGVYDHGTGGTPSPITPKK